MTYLIILFFSFFISIAKWDYDGINLFAWSVCVNHHQMIAGWWGINTFEKIKTKLFCWQRKESKKKELEQEIRVHFLVWKIFCIIPKSTCSSIEKILYVKYTTVRLFEKLSSTMARASSPRPSRSHRYTHRYPRSSSPRLLTRLIKIRTPWTGIDNGSIMSNSRANILFSLEPLNVDDLLTVSLDKLISILFGHVVNNNKRQYNQQNQCDRNQ